jgi:hypothetical protein
MVVERSIAVRHIHLIWSEPVKYADVITGLKSK